MLSRIIFFCFSFFYAKKIVRVFKDTCLSGEFLAPGRYKILWSEKPVLYKITDRHLQSKHKPVFPKYVQFFYSKVFSVLNSTNESFNGSYAILTSNFEVKIFNEEKNEIYTILSDERKKTLHSKFLKLAPLKTTFIKITNSGIIEKFILTNSNSSKEGKDLYYEFLNCYRVFLLNREILNKKNLRYQSIEINNIPPILQSVVKELSALSVDKCIPIIFTHCDLHAGNFLSLNNELWFIDVEYARDEIFFYDIFLNMFVEFWDKNNDVYLKKYLSGEQEICNHIKKCFSAIGFDFDYNCRKEYLFSFLTARLIFDIGNGRRRFRRINQIRYNRYLRRKNISVIKYIEGFDEQH